MIDTSPKFRRINIEIDGKDYTNTLSKSAKKNILWGIRRELLNLDKILAKIPKGLPPSKVIKPDNIYCDQCSAFLHNCAKYFRFLHGKIEVCQVLYDLVLEHKLLNTKPIIDSLNSI